MIHFANGIHQKVVEKPFEPIGAPFLIDGVDILDTLCPVSKKTGLRENPLSLIRKLITDPAKQALLGAMLQELPTDSSQQNLTDEQKFEMCFQRLSMGTPAENDKIRDDLMAIIENYSDSQKVAAEQASSKIVFNDSNANTAEMAAKEG